MTLGASERIGQRLAGYVGFTSITKIYSGTECHDLIGAELGSGGEAHFFTSVCQLSTIVIVEGGVAAPSVGAASIRNFLPSWETS